MAAGFPLKQQEDRFETSHRRVRSNSYRAINAREDLSHHRNLSNQLSKPLFQERTPLSASRRDHKGLSTEASSPPTSPPLTQRKPGRGFLGTLDAAILYFETVQRVPLIPSPVPDEVAYLRQELGRMAARNRTLEQNTTQLSSENVNHQRQREAYERHIGALNTRLLDLQMSLNECREQLHGDSLNLSDIPQVWARPR